MIRKGLICCIALALPRGMTAQADPSTPLDMGRTFRIASKALGETRVIDVTLPSRYDADTARRYPVLVVLDGEFEHHVAASVARFYSAMSELPPLIVIGIRNTARTRDLTPAAGPGFTPPAEGGESGGADRFFTFLAHELIPHIDRSYRTAPMRVLIGHSLGGLFALHALARQPELFTGYVVMEPSTWWNRERPLEEARAALGRPAARRARVMMVNAVSLGLDTTAWGGSKPMVREITISGETHASMAMAGMMQGLRTMFADFKPAEWKPGTRPIAMLAHYDSLAERVGYAAPIPEQAYSVVVRMSIDSRHFDDADVALRRMERAFPGSADASIHRQKLAAERASPAPAGFVRLEIPARRPTPHEARAFLGRWVAEGPGDQHEVVVRASGDTIVVHDRVPLRNGHWDEGDRPVIRVTPDGILEWGLPWFRGLAALLVLRGRLDADGVMTVTREPRGWVPREPGAPDMARTLRFRRVTP
jgi:hypothetical protein